jgi:hypothetical protein
MLQGKPELLRLKKGMLPYVDRIDRMFAGNTVDGSTSFVAGQSCPIALDVLSFDEEATDDPEDQLTPLSIGNKRSSSTSTTASSLSKRSKSPAVRSMDNNMRTHNELASRRVSLLETLVEQRKEEFVTTRSVLSPKISRVAEIAKEMGITHETPRLFKGLSTIIQNESYMDWFLANGPEERRIIIEQVAPVDP